eukprot:5688626-Pleurochrysis_carterae.AAC.3
MDSRLAGWRCKWVRRERAGKAWPCSAAGATEARRAGVEASVQETSRKFTARNQEDLAQDGMHIGTVKRISTCSQDMRSGDGRPLRRAARVAAAALSACAQTLLTQDRHQNLAGSVAIAVWWAGKGEGGLGVRLRGRPPRSGLQEDGLFVGEGEAAKLVDDERLVRVRDERDLLEPDKVRVETVLRAARIRERHSARGRTAGREQECETMSSGMRCMRT